MPGRDPPNVLYVFLDELRADALGCYDHPFVETPAIDALADRGVRFANAYSDCPLCAPQRAALQTSLYPHQTGCSFNWSDPLDADAFAERLDFHDRLREAGYDRFVNVGKFHVSGVSPEDAGFDEHVPVSDGLGADPSTPPEGLPEDEVLRIPGAPETILAGTHPDADETLSARAVDETIERIERAPEGEPWFVRLSLNRPHTPVLPPEPYAGRYAEEADPPDFDPAELDRRPPVLRRWYRHRGFEQFSGAELARIRAHYFGLVSFVDAQLGRVFDALRERGEFDDTLVVLLSDHGSSIGDHGMQVKGPYDSPDIANVPLIVSWPDRLPEGHEYEGLVQLLDLHPTLLDLLGLDVPERYEGTPLTSALRGDDDPVHDAVFSEGSWESVHPGYRQTVRTPEWRYTRYGALGERELIDVGADPRETEDVSGEHPDVVAEMEDRLDEWVRETPPMTLRESVERSR